MSPDQGRPIVLLHGFAGSYERTWRQPGVADILGDLGRPLVGIDLLGHGSAAKPHDPAAYAELPALARAEIDGAAPGGSVDAVGFSLGAQTLLRLVAETPGPFGRVVVAGVGDTSFEVRDAEVVARALEGPPDPENQAGRHLRVLADVPGNDLAALAACLRRPHQPLTVELLGSIPNEVTVVVGDQDELAGDAQPLVDALPNARLVTLPRTDHASTPESFAFIDVLLDVLVG